MYFETALEMYEDKLNKRRMSTASYAANKDRDPFTLELLEKQDEALSIILESAKLFHEHSVPRMFSELKSSLGEQECKNIKTVYGVPIESVGIEVEQ